MDKIEKWLDDLSQFQDLNRPLVTLSYAQSLDGCLATRRGEKTRISGEESMRLTHLVRSRHDAVLVGIGTLLSDDPQLTVRLLPGKDPRPVILDGSLRTPLDCKLLMRKEHGALLFTRRGADPAKLDALKRKGVTVFERETPPGNYLELRDVLSILWENGIKRIMVEGGAEVIASFLAERLVGRAVVTIAPFWMGGLASVGRPLAESPQPGRLKVPSIPEPSIEMIGKDLVVFGRVGEGTL